MRAYNFRSVEAEMGDYYKFKSILVYAVRSMPARDTEQYPI